jgi:hypothetical protein
MRELLFTCVCLFVCRRVWIFDEKLFLLDKRRKCSVSEQTPFSFWLDFLDYFDDFVFFSSKYKPDIQIHFFFLLKQKLWIKDRKFEIVHSFSLPNYNFFMNYYSKQKLKQNMRSTTKQKLKRQPHEKEKEKPICSGGVHCLKLEDKEHSTQFIHLNPVNFSFFSFTLFSLLECCS